MRWGSEREKNLEEALVEREKNLEEALVDSCTCILELNMRRNNAERKMGALAPVSRGPEEAHAALASYDHWVKKHVSNELADKSDEAMKALGAALTNSANVDLVLGLPHIEEEILLVLGLSPKNSRDSSDDFDDSDDALETESKSADFAAGGGEGMAIGLALRALFILHAASIWSAWSPPSMNSSCEHGLTRPALRGVAPRGVAPRGVTLGTVLG